MDLTSVESLCGLLSRSRLLTSDQVRSLRLRWLREAGSQAADAHQLTRWLVEREYLTDYQAEMLLQGKWERHFLNDYKILGRIGKGRVARVFKAVHRLGQVVAIKVLPPSKARDPALLARFRREARLATRLVHHNIVRTFQVDEDNGLHFLVMEYLQGQTLKEVLAQSGRLSVSDAVAIVHQALTGLQYLHEEGIVHRDLHPSNLMLVGANEHQASEQPAQALVKILDIGAGRALFDEGSPGGGPIDLTTRESQLGEPDYMAPEQARDAHGSDTRADIYSLGCTLYHALTGQPPFPDTNLVRKMVRHATEMPRPLKAFNPQAEGLQHVVETMMAKDPAQRYTTPEQAARQLQAYLHAAAPAPRSQGVEVKRTADQQRLQAQATEDAAAVEPAGSAPAPAAEHVVPPAPTDQPTVRTAAAGPPVSRLAALGERMRLSRRDYLLLGVGAGGVVLAEAIGWLLVKALGRSANTSTNEPPEPERSPEPPEAPQTGL